MSLAGAIFLPRQEGRGTGQRSGQNGHLQGNIQPDSDPLKTGADKGLEARQGNEEMRMKEGMMESKGRRYRMNVDLDRDLARELRKVLIDEGKTLSEWVREEAERFLRERIEGKDEG
jgi:hypothetical protein